ncbi:phage replication initiation protein, NGO0469 family [Adhaeribacter aquaticus]|uniref:phage replication initiation protein, NGO0469 family n=1 Tax=Adhaeribacter aquaticus TaxID=299567 RepID=UPI0003F9ECE8|nr:hypothetical protein [Adhaeribacter aquaticus]
MNENYFAPDEEIIATSTGEKSFELIPAGNYLARCYSMILLGTVTEEYEGRTKENEKVRITWELPTETRVYKEENGPQPSVISKEYTLSMGDKANLRKDLESWRGKQFTDDEAKSFNVSKLIGIPCQLNIIHKVSKQGKSYATIATVSPLMKGIECPPQVNPSFIFNIRSFQQDKFNSLPQFLKEKIKATKEGKALNIQDTTPQPVPQPQAAPAPQPQPVAQPVKVAELELATIDGPLPF